MTKKNKHSTDNIKVLIPTIWFIRNQFIHILFYLTIFVLFNYGLIVRYQQLEQNEISDFKEDVTHEARQVALNLVLAIGAIIGIRTGKKKNLAKFKKENAYLYDKVNMWFNVVGEKNKAIWMGIADDRLIIDSNDYKYSRIKFYLKRNDFWHWLLLGSINSLYFEIAGLEKPKIIISSNYPIIISELQKMGASYAPPLVT